MKKTDKAWQNFVQIDHCYGACQKVELAPPAMQNTSAIRVAGTVQTMAEIGTSRFMAVVIGSYGQDFSSVGT